MPSPSKNVRVRHYAELLLHSPFAITEQVELEPGETQAKAIARLSRKYGNELTAVAFYDRVELKTGGLTFLSEIINMQKSIAI